MGIEMHSRIGKFPLLATASRLWPRLAFTALMLLALSPTSHAGSVDFTVVGMFPKDAGEFGFADLSQARQFSWFPQFESQIVPVALYGFEQFLETAEMVQASPIDSVAWSRVTAKKSDSDSPSTGGGQLVAVAIGSFDPDTIRSFLDVRGAHALQIERYKLYGAGTGSGSDDMFFSILDSSTIVFGPLEPLKRILRIRAGQEDSLLHNEKMLNRIASANGEGIFWGVLDSAQAGGIIERFVPDAANFRQSRDLIAKLKDLVITIKGSTDVEVDFGLTSGSPSDAVVISELLQAGLLLRRYQTNSETNPELGPLLDAVRIAANGNLLDIARDLTPDQLTSLIEHNAFIMRM